MFQDGISGVIFGFLGSAYIQIVIFFLLGAYFVKHRPTPAWWCRASGSSE